MRKLFSFFYYRTRMRYWRQRARTAERLLEAEVWRNRAREDTFVSASIMGQRGMFGVAPRTGPAYQTSIAAVPPTLPTQDLSGADYLEFQTQWLPDARRANVSDQQALKEFREVIVARRRPLADEPFSN